VNTSEKTSHFFPLGDGGSSNPAPVAKEPGVPVSTDHGHVKRCFVVRAGKSDLFACNKIRIVKRGKVFPADP
jgi:hypothetical protein